MPYRVIDRLAELVDRHLHKSFSDTRILVLGIAYKKNIEDMRESPALKLMELIESRGAQAAYHDPHVPEITPTRKHGSLEARRSVELTPETLASFDAVLIATDHDEVDYALVVRQAKLVVDTRNICARLGLEGAHLFKA